MTASNALQRRAPPQPSKAAKTAASRAALLLDRTPTSGLEKVFAHLDPWLSHAEMVAALGLSSSPRAGEAVRSELTAPQGITPAENVDPKVIALIKDLMAEIAATSVVPTTQGGDRLVLVHGLDAPLARGKTLYVPVEGLMGASSMAEQGLRIGTAYAERALLSQPRAQLIRYLAGLIDTGASQLIDRKLPGQQPLFSRGKLVEKKLLNALARALYELGRNKGIDVHDLRGAQAADALALFALLGAGYDPEAALEGAFRQPEPTPKPATDADVFESFDVPGLNFLASLHAPEADVLPTQPHLRSRQERLASGLSAWGGRFNRSDFRTGTEQIQQIQELLAQSKGEDGERPGESV